MMWRAGFAALVLAAIAAPDAWAIHQLKSLYTVVDLGECKAVKAHAATDVRMCEELPGYPSLCGGERSQNLSKRRVNAAAVAGRAADALRGQHGVRAGDQAHNCRMAVHHP